MEDENWRFGYIIEKVLKVGEDNLWLSGGDLKNVKIFKDGADRKLSIRILEQIINRVYAKTSENHSIEDYDKQIASAYSDIAGITLPPKS